MSNNNNGDDWFNRLQSENSTNNANTSDKPNVGGKISLSENYKPGRHAVFSSKDSTKNHNSEENNN